MMNEPVELYVDGLGFLPEEDVYGTYLRNTTEKDLLQNWFALFLEQTKFSLPHYLAPADPGSIVDLGCSRGDTSLRLIQALQRGRYNIEHYAAVDPHQAQLDAFRTKVQKAESETSRDRWRSDTAPMPKVTYHCSTLEDFVGDPNAMIFLGKYDLAIASHILYYVADWDKAIRKIMDLAHNALIVHHGVRGINTLHEMLPDLVDRTNHAVSTSLDVACAVGKLVPEGRYWELHTVPSEITIAKAKDPENREGQSLISFFLGRRYTSYSAEERSKIHATLAKLPDVITHDIGIIAIYDSNPLSAFRRLIQLPY